MRGHLFARKPPCNASLSPEAECATFVLLILLRPNSTVRTRLESQQASGDVSSSPLCYVTKSCNSSSPSRARGFDIALAVSAVGSAIIVWLFVLPVRCQRVVVKHSGDRQRVCGGRAWSGATVSRALRGIIFLSSSGAMPSASLPDLGCDPLDKSPDGCRQSACNLPDAREPRLQRASRGDVRRQRLTVRLHTLNRLRHPWPSVVVCSDYS